ncbi:MAG: nuclear transport factor 2 family protein [Marmoricola sp.]
MRPPTPKPPSPDATAPAPLAAWHAIAASGDPSGLSDWLAEDVVFRSPAVHTPQEGRTVTTAYLSAALTVLGPTLEYEHQWWDDRSAVLEFTAGLDASGGTVTVHGIDMMRWNAEGRCTGFTVMVRPFKGLTRLMELMAAELTRGG